MEPPAATAAKQFLREPDDSTGHFAASPGWWGYFEVTGYRSSRSAFVLLAVAALVYLYLPVWIGFQGRHNNDFKHIYFGMELLTQRESPYPGEMLILQARRDGVYTSLNPYVYLPFTGLSLAFLKPFGFRAASAVFFFLNHALLLSGCWLIARELFVRRPIAAFAAMLFVFGLDIPWFRTLTAGQLNAVLFFCYALSFVLLRRSRNTAAGMVMGFAAMFKLAPALFAVVFLLTRNWRALASMLITIAGLLLISIMAVGLDIHLQFLPVLHQMGYGKSTAEQFHSYFWKDPSNQSFNSLFTHLLVAGNGITKPWISATQSAANLITEAVTSALILLFLMTFRRSYKSRIESEACFFSAVGLSLLIPSLMWDHYLTIAVLPAAWLISLQKSAHRAWLTATVAACILLTMLPWDFGSRAFHSGPEVLLMSMKLFPMLALFVLCLTAPLLVKNSDMKDHDAY
jgi:hypothetical protein